MRNNCSGIVAAESSAAVAREKGSGRETDTLDRSILKTKPIIINEIYYYYNLTLEKVLEKTPLVQVWFYTF